MNGPSRLSRLSRAIAAALAGAMVALGPPAPALRAQARVPIAIVGARLVDGSGNEPFVGTIVFAGGRIIAVGRQVEVPADAQTVDGAGRTVLPGVIDAGLGPAGAPIAGDAGTRRLGRALAAGITTAATTDAPPAAAANPVTPRLLAQPRDGVDPGSAAVAGAWVLRNNTMAIGLDGDARAAIAAARAAKARLALAGLAGADGGVDPARVAATGLTPLDAVTAMTSGGAWALGLQSDRGLLAPGMRADLVVVTGDPTASLDALGAVERVYLSGIEVDRAALLRTPPPPAPASVAPPTASAAPSPAPAAAASPAPLRARSRAPKNARVDPLVTSRPAVAGAPAAADAATPPLPERAGPSASAAPTPAPLATPAPATAVVGERVRDALLDDFERGDTVSAIGPAWVGFGNEGGGVATTVIMGRVVKGLRDHALLVSARMGGAREPFARAALRLDADDRPVDVSRFRGLRFDARGEGRYRVVFVTRGVADGRYHESYFSGSPLWTPVNIPFASVGQTGPGLHVTWTGRDVVEIRFEIARDAGRLGWLELDNVTFY